MTAATLVPQWPTFTAYPAPRLCIAIAHHAPIVAAGMLAFLSSVKDWHVRLWSELQSDSPEASMRPHIVLSDAQSAPCILRRVDNAKLVLIAEPGAAESGLSDTTATARVSLNCSQDQLLGLLRAMAGDESIHRPAVRGGLAPGVRRRVQEFIQSNLSENVDISDLAGLAKLSSWHFARAFKQSFGMPPHAFITQQRIHLASTLIRDGEEPLSGIAMAVGFADQSHLTRVFKTLVGETPSQYRRRHR